MFNLSINKSGLLKKATVLMAVAAGGVCLQAAPTPQLKGKALEYFNAAKYNYHWGFSDEFNGTAGKFTAPNSSKWTRVHPTGWKGNKRFVYKSGLSYVYGNRLVLESRPRSDNKFDCGIVSSKWPAKYGYFEIKCAAADNKIASSFWFYDKQHYEIDVFEHFPATSWKSTLMNTNIHHFIWNSKTGDMDDKLNVPKAISLGNNRKVTQWNTYGVLRTPSAIHFIANGELKRTIWKSSVKASDWPNDRWLPIIIDTLVYDWQAPKDQWGNNTEPAKKKGLYLVEYFRAWTP